MLTSGWINKEIEGNKLKLYISRLTAVEKPLPAVVIIQEIWGCDKHILDVADRLAKAGYLAIAPDLYAANGERPEVLKEERIEKVKAFLNTMPATSWGDETKRESALNELPPLERNEIGPTFHEVYSGLKRMPQYLNILHDTIRFLEDYEFSRGQKIGTIGFCMGGALSALMACNEPNLSGAVVFYGNLPDKEKVQGINCPVLGIFGSLDERITSQVNTFKENMQNANKKPFV